MFATEQVGGAAEKRFGRMQSPRVWWEELELELELVEAARETLRYAPPHQGRFGAFEEKLRKRPCRLGRAEPAKPCMYPEFPIRRSSFFFVGSTSTS